MREAGFVGCELDAVAGRAAEIEYGPKETLSDNLRKRGNRKCRSHFQGNSVTPPAGQDNVLALRECSAKRIIPILFAIELVALKENRRYAIATRDIWR